MPTRVNNAQSQCCYITADPITRVSENEILFCSTNGPYNDLVSPYRTKGRSNVKKQALSPVQRQKPFTGAEPRTLHRYKTKENQEPFTGTEPRTALPVQNLSVSPVQRQRPFTGAEPRTLHRCKPRAALPIYRTKGPSPVQNQRMPLYH